MSPLLFILCMEYFSRLMTYVGKQPEFTFHRRCKSLGLNHLCFANDVILFCKGDFKSIQMMLQGINLFADTSGLKVNHTMFDFYSYGLSKHENVRIKVNSGFKHGILPFRNLGVPINTKKLSGTHCEKLLRKLLLK